MTTAREESVRLADLLRREHHALAEFLIALSIFDRERRWVELGYSSLFYYLHRELGLPKGPAHYRKTAAELIQKYPELMEPLRDGRLNLSTIVEVANVITPENRAQVLPRFFGASRREAKEVVAELRPDPAPPLRTVVTEVPPSTSQPTLSSSVVAPPNVAVGPVLQKNQSPEVEVPAVALPSAPREVARPRRTQVEPLTAELSRLHLTVSRRLLAKLARARDALSHSHPGASEETILELGLDLVIERHRKRRGIGARPRKQPANAEQRSTSATLESVADGPPPITTRAPASVGRVAPTPAPARRSRHVPAAVWRAVWERDGGQCVWPVEGGGVCGVTGKLQLDHVDGFALGGETTVDRCRLLCAFHQDVHARVLFGDDVMDTYTRPKGPRCSEPVARTSPAAPAGAHAPP